MFQDPFDDIVFEKRNKAYGAYFLRGKYAEALILGFFVAMLCVLCMYIYSVYNSYISSDDYNFSIDYTNYIKYDVDEELLKIAQYKVEAPIPKLENAFIPMIKKQKDIVEEENDTTITKGSNTKNQEGDSSSVVPQKADSSAVDIDTSKGDFLVRIDSLPKFNGDVNGFRTYLVSRITYPDTVLLRLIGGKVTVSLVITESGSISTIRLDKIQSSAWAQELVRVIKRSPRWQPAYAKGKPVSIMYTLPLYFLN